MQMKLTFRRHIQPFRILHLEQFFSSDFLLDSGGFNLKLKLGSIIDRIDEISEGYRVIDYKTGFSKYSTHSIEDLFKRNDPKRNNAIFQVLFYCLVLKNYLIDKPLVPSLFFIRDLFKSEFDYHIKHKSGEKKYSSIFVFKEVEANFIVGLNALFTEIFSQNLPFVQSVNNDICQNCSYKLICHRN